MDYEIMMNNNLKIGMEAPDFDGISTTGEISLSNYKGKWIVFFSHPGDFTPEKYVSLGEIVDCIFHMNFN